MVDEDLSHDTGSDAIKPRSAIGRYALLINQPQVSLVNERGGLERVAVGFAPERAGSLRVEMVVEGRQ